MDGIPERVPNNVFIRDDEDGRRTFCEKLNNISNANTQIYSIKSRSEVVVCFGWLVVVYYY